MGLSVSAVQGCCRNGRKTGGGGERSSSAVVQFNSQFLSRRLQSAATVMRPADLATYRFLLRVP